MRFRHSQTIAAPVQRLWEVTQDVASWPRWIPTMTSLHPLKPGPLALHSQIQIKQPGLPALIWTVRQLEPPHLLSWETHLPWGLRMRGTHRIQPAPEGCQNQLELELSGTGSWLFGILCGPSLWLALALENRGFSRAARTPT
ncbi:SRPBCC family protein [bacterium]|nr:SRPBCC family protein [bacterium]